MKAQTVLACRNKTGETPTYVADENALYWVDIEGQQLNRLQLDTSEHTTWSAPERLCGVVPRAKGGLIVSFPQTLMHFDPRTGDFAKLMDLDLNSEQNRVNEVKCDPQGRLWFGTMRQSAHERSPADPFIAALYVIRQGEQKRVLENIAQANTLAWSPNHRHLYFADSHRKTIWRFKVEGESLGQREVFFDRKDLGIPDGSTIDEEGYLWNCRYGEGCVLRLSPDGSIDRKVEVPATNPTSCVFAGKDLTTLYITSACSGMDRAQLEQNPAEGGLFAVHTSIRGQPTHAYAY